MYQKPTFRNLFSKTSFKGTIKIVLVKGCGVNYFIFSQTQCHLKVIQLVLKINHNYLPIVVLIRVYGYLYKTRSIVWLPNKVDSVFYNTIIIVTAIFLLFLFLLNSLPRY